MGISRVLRMKDTDRNFLTSPFYINRSIFRGVYLNRSTMVLE